jgi:Fic family protein
MVAHDYEHVNVFEWVSSWLTRRVAPMPTKALDWTSVPSITDAELDELRKLLRRHGTLTNQEVASLAGVSKGEASKRVSKAVKAGIVSRVKAGKYVAITLH